KGMILRGYNTQSTSINVTFKLWKKFLHAEIINLDETFLDNLPISTDGTVSLELAGNKIISIRSND
ncbi:MAG: glycosyl hydrolase-related protein, partial [Acidobacteriaceae bacterium]